MFRKKKIDEMYNVGLIIHVIFQRNTGDQEAQPKNKVRVNRSFYITYYGSF